MRTPFALEPTASGAAERQVQGLGEAVGIRGKAHMVAGEGGALAAEPVGLRVLGADGQPVEELYAVGEVAGFGGGGVHGYAALEGTFLGGCIFSGRSAGRAAAAVA